MEYVRTTFCYDDGQGNETEEEIVVECAPGTGALAQMIYNTGGGYISLQEAADFAAAGRVSHAADLAAGRAALHATGHTINAFNHEAAEAGNSNG